MRPDFSHNRQPVGSNNVVMSTTASATVLALAAFALLASAARAESARVTIRGKVTFSAAQLEDALALRAPSTPAATVVVEPAGTGLVAIAVGPRRRVVKLGDLRGAAAARMVALAAIDLLIPSISPQSPPPAVVDVEAPAAVSATPVLARTRSVPHARATLDALPPTSVTRPIRYAAMSHILAGNVQGAAPLTALSFDLAVPVTARFSAAFALGVAAAADLGEFPGDTAIVAIPMHIGLGWQYGGGTFALRGGAVAVPYKIRHCGSVLYSGAKLGVGGTARVTLPVGSRLRAVVGFGVDAYAPSFESYDVCTKQLGEGVTYAFGHLPTYADASVAARVGIGIAWDVAQ